MFLGYLIYAFPAVAVLSLLSYLPFGLYAGKKKEKRPFIRRPDHEHRWRNRRLWNFSLAGCLPETENVVEGCNCAGA